MSQIRAIDLFCGIGGFRLGFQRTETPVDFVFSSDIDKFARQTYKENFGEEPEGDITVIREEDVPSHDLLLAGFPCQPFSNAGLRQGFDDIRGTLFFDIARIAKYHQPKALILENVKGLVSHDKGRTFKTIVSTLEDLGYKVYHSVLNAKDWGLPQNRARVFIVALREPVATDFIFPLAPCSPTRVGDILEQNVDLLAHTLSDRAWEGMKRHKEKHEAKGNGFGYGLVNADSPYTRTLLARYCKDGSDILIEQDDGANPRRLTVREAARLQGFPDSFRIPVSRSQAYKQFGNAVAVTVVKAIAEELLKVWN